MGTRIILSTLVLCCLVAKHEFKKVGLEKPKTSFSTPESTKYNDVFEVDETESNRPEDWKEGRRSPEDNATKPGGDGRRSSDGGPPARAAPMAQRRRNSPSLKRIVEAEMKISNSDFQVNGILYSSRNTEMGYVKSSVCKTASSLVSREKKNRDKISDAVILANKNNNLVGSSHFSCPDYIESIGSLRKDILIIKDELSSLVQRFHSVVNEFNSTKKKCIKLKYQWRLNGRCDKDESQHRCDFSCPDSLHYPSTPKTPIGRSSSQLRLLEGPSDVDCAVQLNGFDYIDLGEWAGSCVAQPDRCTVGLSLTVWLRLRLRPGRNGSVASLLAGGDPGPAGRGFALIATRRHGLERVLLTVTMRDATHVWNSEGVLEGLERWHHFAFTWSINHGLKLFVNGKAVTRHRSVVRETSPPSARSRLVVGISPGSQTPLAGSFALARLSLYLSHLQPKDIATIYYEETEQNSIGN